MTERLATVNMERVLSETQEGKRVIDEIRSREEPKKKDYQNIVNEIVNLRNKYQSSAAMMKPEEALKMRQAIEQKELSAMRFQETTLRELENYRLETMANFEKKVFPIIDRLSKQKNLLFLFPYPQRWMIYADKSVDITDEIISEIDKEVAPDPGPGSSGKIPRAVPKGGGSRPKGNVKV